VAADLVAGVPGVASVHHLHAWSLNDARPMMTLHAVIADSADRDRLLAQIQARLHERFGVAHATVQIERENCEPDPAACHDAATATAHDH
jgi:cobalt-zinc-cadmium efflux system protein